MKNFIINSLFFLCILSACQSGSSDTSPAATNATTTSIAKVVSVSEFEQLLQTKNVQLIDVRTSEEVAQGMIRGATHNDFYQDNFQSNLEKLDPQKPVLVYCKSGGRSGKTTTILKKMGFSEVYDLEGGYTDWKAKH